MSFCLPLAYHEERRAKRRAAEAEPLLQHAEVRAAVRSAAQLRRQHVALRDVCHACHTVEMDVPPGMGPVQAPHKRSHAAEVALLAIPTAFDLVATVLMNVRRWRGGFGRGSRAGAGVVCGWRVRAAVGRRWASCTSRPACTR
jgi:hypothetical protein